MKKLPKLSEEETKLFKKPKWLLAMDCAYNKKSADEWRLLYQRECNKYEDLRLKFSGLNSKFTMLKQTIGKLTEAITILRDQV